MSKPDVRPARIDPAPVFAALGDRTRLALLARLTDGRPRSIAALSGEAGDLTRQAVTKHLHVLADAGLVSQARVGRETRFTYVPEPLGQARTWLNEVSARWDEALSRLRELVEAPD